jgi:hypothetical protein
MTGMRASVYVSIGFLLAYAIPGLLIACIWSGTHFGCLDMMVFVPLLVGYVGVPLVQSCWPYVLPPQPEVMRQSGAWQLYHRLILFLSLPAQLAMLAVATRAWVSGGLSPVGRFGLLLTTGVFSAMFAINIGHHLIHQRQPSVSAASKSSICGSITATSARRSTSRHRPEARASTRSGARVLPATSRPLYAWNGSGSPALAARHGAANSLPGRRAACWASVWARSSGADSVWSSLSCRRCSR